MESVSHWLSQYAYPLMPFWALVVDTLLGDPRSRFHPVVLIGNVISFFEDLLYNKNNTEKQQLRYGGYVVMLTIATVVGFCWILLQLAGRIHTGLFYVLGVLLIYISISPRSLAEAGREISDLLHRQDLPEARHKVGWIVGRDTKELDESEITRATIETVSENTVDGIVAPLFFFALFGPLGAIGYRAVNTMDSMLGYKNDRYLYFGRVAAILDDICNYIPARLTFLFLVLSAWILGFDGKAAWRMGLRDGHKHPSPNGGYAEAPVAGALGIRLGGYNTYGERRTFRAYMGDPLVTMEGKHITYTIRMMYSATVMMVIVSGLAYLWWR